VNRALALEQTVATRSTPVARAIFNAATAAVRRRT
jgi:hypothetical protein